MEKHLEFKLPASLMRKETLGWPLFIAAGVLFLVLCYLYSGWNRAKHKVPLI